MRFKCALYSRNRNVLLISLGRIILGLSVLAAIYPTPAYSAFLKDLPITLKQPNGELVRAFVTGDENCNFIHDEEGYVAVRDPGSRFWVYGQQAGGRIRPSTHILGRGKPDLPPISRATILSLQKPALSRSDLRSARAGSKTRGPMAVDSLNASSVSSDGPWTPSLGTVNNIAIFVRFADDPEFTAPLSSYAALFNASGDSDVSLYNYYKEASYNQLSVATSFYPNSAGTIVSYRDMNPRAYYQAYDVRSNPLGYADGSEYLQRERALLDRAVNAISDQVPNSLEIDGNGDGFIDHICLIYQGHPDGWASMLWPHQAFANASSAARIQGKQIRSYNVQIDAMLLPDWVGVLCHEFFHSLGAPDLYNYSLQAPGAVGNWFDSVGEWDLMASDGKVPQHMGAYMKYRYGKWIPQLPAISQDGLYALRPLTDNVNNAYRIASPYSSTEWFVLEYRKKSGVFEQSLPGEGLLVYRINTSYYGDASGPPDEVYLYRPGGTLYTNGFLGYAPYSSNSGRTELSDLTEPSSFLSAGGSGGLLLTSVGSPGEQISFRIAIGQALHRVSAPSITDGPIQGKSSTSYSFTSSAAVDSKGCTMQYRFFWDDGTFSDWAQDLTVRHSFFGARSYKIRVQARCASSPDSYSPWSAPYLVTMDFETPSQFYMKQRVPAPTDSRMMIYSMATGDLDADGKQELVVMYAYLPTNYAKDRIQDLVIYRWVDGKLQKIWNRAGSSLNYPEGWYIKVADIDGDGRAEIIKNGEMIKYSMGEYIPIPAPDLDLPVAVGDANNDGMPEVISFDGFLYQYNAGAWKTAGHFDVGGASTVMALGDTDGDGKNEIVVSTGNGFNTGTITVLRATSGGNFSVVWQKSNYMSGATDIKIADWDSDGKNEIILAYGQDSSVHVLKYANSAYSEIWSHIFNAYSGMGWVPTLALGRFNPATTGLDLAIGLGGHCQQPAEGSGVYLENVGMLFHDSDTSYGVGSIILMDIDQDGQNELIAGSTDSYIYILSAYHTPTTPTSIAALGASTFSTRGPSGDLVDGYSTVTLNTGHVPYGTAVFSLVQNGFIVSEAGVPASPPTLAARIFVDARTNLTPGANTDVSSVSTGLAAVNAGVFTANMSLKLRDSNGSLLSEGVVRLDAGQQIAKFLDQLTPGFVLPAGFAENGSGSLEITSDQPVSFLALRLTVNQRGELLLTTTPVADLSRTSTTGSMAFPQIAVGGGYQTTLLLLNTSDEIEAGKLKFFSDKGTPFALRFIDMNVADTTYAYTIPAGGFLRLIADPADSEVRSGWAQLVPDAGKSTPAGAAVFSLTSNGILVTEAAVPAASATQHVRIFVDKSDSHDTGVAIANPGDVANRVTATAYQMDGITPAGTGAIPLDLAALGHDARFAGELVAGLPNGFTGILDLTGTFPFSATTLRSLTNGRGDFLLTTFPIADINQPAPNPILFPQIAAGGGYQTQIILLGSGGGTSTITLRYFGSGGSPISVSP